MQVVHVAGAVARPGVVHLEVGARVVDAIEAAGGMTNRAAADALNLAAAVADGDQVHVPTVRELAEAAASQVSPAGPTGPQPAATAAHLIDLNAATLAELEDLPGIGPVLAQRILEWRDANGAFVDVGQLREVSGIGESTFQDIAPLAHVG